MNNYHSLSKYTLGLFLVLTLSVLFSCKNGGGSGDSMISGTLKNAPAKQKLILEHLSVNGFVAIDSTETGDNGSFSFQAVPKGIDFYRVVVHPRNYALFIADSIQPLKIEAEFESLNKTVKISGSKDNDFLMELNTMLKGFYRQNDSLMGIWKNRPNGTDENLLQLSLKKSFDEIMQNQNAALQQFIAGHAKSFSILSAVENLNPDLFAGEYRKVDSIAQKLYPSSHYVQSFHKRTIDILQLSPGSVAPEISMRSPEGKTIPLSSLRGKYVLLDFWASWCQPCRAQSANLVRLYNKFKDKGFTIYSVSLDNNPEAWKKAIAQDGLVWTHVSDLANWESEAVKLYQLESIPRTFLLDKEGKIIHKGLIGYELEAAVEQLFK